MIRQKLTWGKYLWNVLKNRSNEIRTNEIRTNEISIKRGHPEWNITWGLVNSSISKASENLHVVIFAKIAKPIVNSLPELKWIGT